MPGAVLMRMSPCRFHVPPRNCGASARVSGDPPLTLTFFNLSPAANAMYFASGDQKGNDAPSVPASGRATDEPSERTQISDLPSAPRPTNAT